MALPLRFALVLVLVLVLRDLLIGGGTFAFRLAVGQLEIAPTLLVASFG